jgi:hypothetical protein
MKLAQIILASIGSAAFIFTSSAPAQTLADWTFDGSNTPVGVNNTPAPATGSGTADAIGMGNTYGSSTSVNTDDVLLGKSSDTGTNGVADLTNEWRVRGQPGSSNANGWNSAAPIGTQGAQFFASTAGASAGASGIKVSFDWYDTSAGEANMEFLYTTNGGTTWNNLALTLGGSDSGLSNKTNSTSANTVMGAYVQAAGSGGQDWFTGLTATITDLNALNDAGFGIEMVNASTGADDITASGAAENNTSGNWRFDNILIQAVPEPSSWILGFGAAVVFVALRLLRPRTNC